MTERESRFAELRVEARDRGARLHTVTFTATWTEKLPGSTEFRYGDLVVLDPGVELRVREATTVDRGTRWTVELVEPAPPPPGRWKSQSP